MSNTKITDAKAQELFAKVILTDKEIDNIKFTGHNIGQIILRQYSAISDSEISMKKVNMLSEINNYYFNGIGQREHVGTAWGAYNAITGYFSNVDNSTGIKRMDSILFGDKSRKIELAGNIMLAA